MANRVLVWFTLRVYALLRHTILAHHAGHGSNLISYPIYPQFLSGDNTCIIVYYHLYYLCNAGRPSARCIIVIIVYYRCTVLLRAVENVVLENFTG